MKAQGKSKPGKYVYTKYDQIDTLVKGCGYIILVGEGNVKKN